MTMTETNENPDHEKIAKAVELTRQEKFDEAIVIFEEVLPNLTSGSIPDKRVAAGAVSYYGVCLAKVRRKYAEAVQYCNVSIKTNIFDPDHRYNLALVYLERDDRRAAVDALSSGLRLNPKHPRINEVFDEIGRRQKPVIPFLARNNPLNVWLGKKRRHAE
ncbi:MAG TPA: tetratricopeptide repeat protein [Acidobacteria bacterium]|nr:tetratricopeptide repeat protein [Acidobacteriota bacterium]